MQRGVEESTDTDARADPHADSDALRDRWAWRARLRQRRHTRIALRIAVGVLGTLLILAGLATGWVPGPGGIPLVLLGLLVWSSEFLWAHRLMDRLRRLLQYLRGWSRRRKIVAVAVGLALGATALYASLWFNGVPAWLPGPVESLLLQLPGLAPSGRRG